MRQKKTLSLGFLLGSLLLLIGCSTIYVYPSNLINTDDAKKTIERLILSQPADHVDNPVKKVEVSSEQIQIFSEQSHFSMWSFAENTISRTDTIEKSHFNRTEIHNHGGKYFDVKIYNSNNDVIYEFVTDYEDDARTFCDAIYTWSES